MGSFLVVIAALAGALVGSFVTVVAHRVPRGESIVTPRSRCPECGASIAAYDNVPVVSWVVLRGRSRCCRETISGRYPLTEICLATLFAAVAIRFEDEVGQILLGLVFVSMLVAISLTDLDRRIIPNKILAVSALLGTATLAIAEPSALPEHLAAAVGAGGVFFLVALAYPGGIGMGDVKLAAAMGLFLGVEVIPALLIALLVGSAVGLAMILREGAAARKRAIPFGPFLAIGGVAGLLAGDALIDAYLNTFA